ncbi:MAG TPA: TIR domain-containing protein [Solirubrobacterales bacterium]
MSKREEHTNGTGGNGATVAAPQRRTYVSQTDVPRHTIDEALRVGRAIAENYGKQPTRPLAVAKAMGMQPTSGKFKTLTGASVAFGLTEGGSQAEVISLTELGRRIVAPTVEGDDFVAKREAALRPRVMREYLEKYDGSPLPSPQIGQNVLEEDMGVSSDHSERAQGMIVGTADALGLLTDINGSRYVDLSAVPSSGPDPAAHDNGVPGEDATSPVDALGDPDPPAAPIGPVESSRPAAIFVGARKGRARDQLTKLLTEYGIPHKVAEDEANRARPIPTKVKETMEECGAAILIFTADEEFRDAEGNCIWRPSDNVVHELGAAGMAYGDRIIIFKETQVQLASNFESIGFIEFDGGQLDARVNELLRELIALKILTLSVNA